MYQSLLDKNELHGRIEKDLEGGCVLFFFFFLDTALLTLAFLSLLPKVIEKKTGSTI